MRFIFENKNTDSTGAFISFRLSVACRLLERMNFELLVCTIQLKKLAVSMAMFLETASSLWLATPSSRFVWPHPKTFRAFSSSSAVPETSINDE